MNPRQFLLWGGIILLALGVLGLFLMGPTPQQSILGEFFWLDTTENIAHLLFGAIAIGAYFWLKDSSLVKYLVILVGIVAAIAAIFGFVNVNSEVPNVAISNMENPADNILHAVVAVWALGVSLIPSRAGVQAPRA